jgi:hypothetical protein
MYDLEMLRDRLLQRHRELLSRHLSAAQPGERRPRCSTTSRATTCWSSTRATSRSRRSAACTRRPRPQGDAGRARLPPAERARQPAAEVRGVGRAHDADVYVSATPGDYELEQRRAWSSSRSSGPPASSTRGRGAPVGNQVDDLLAEIRCASSATSACWSPRSPSAWPRTSPSTTRSSACACATCTPTSTRSSAWRSCATCGAASSTCWWASTCCARASTCPRCPGGHPRRRQGGLPAQQALAHPDHRPRRPQRRRPGHHVRRQGDRLMKVRHRRDRPPPRRSSSPTTGARHHASFVGRSRPLDRGNHPALRPRSTPCDRAGDEPARTGHPRQVRRGTGPPLGGGSRGLPPLPVRPGGLTQT